MAIDLKAVITAEDKASPVLKSFAGKASSSFTSLGANVAKFGSILGAATTAFGVMAIKNAADTQMIRTNLDVLTGSAENGKRVFTDLSKFAAITPFEVSDLAKASQILLSFGVSTEKLLPNLKALGDVSLGNKDKLNSLAMTFGQVQSLGRLTGDNLREMINNGFNPLNEMSKKTGKSVAELRDEMEKGAISADMVTESFTSATAQGGQFFGGMEQGAKTFNGVMSTLQDNINTTIRGIVGLSETGDVVKGGLFDKVSVAVSQLIVLIEQNKEAIISLGAAFINGLVTALMVVINVLVQVFGWLNEHREVAKALAIAVGVVLTGAFAAWAVAVIAATWPILAIIAAITALSYGVMKLIDNWKEVKKWLSVVQDSLYVFLGPIGMVIKAIKDLVQNWDKIKNFGGDIGGSIKGFFGFRAEGGPVTGGKPYVVGERGPELFVPGQSGNIVSNEKMSGGSTVINISFGGVNMASNMDADEVGRRIANQISLVKQGAF